MEVRMNELIENQACEGYEQAIYQSILRNWDKVAKPLDSMGVFEPVIAQIGAIQGTNRPAFSNRVVVVFAADNGIVAEGVSQAGQEVTAICANNMCNKRTSVCVMAQEANTETVIVDVGLATPVNHPTMIQKNVRRGTRNFLLEPAMTQEEVYQAMEVGFSLAKSYKKQGYDVLGVGEIGIGNTTTSSAVAAALLKEEVKNVTGYGAGLSEEGLRRKIQVIEEAIAKYDLYHADAVTILRTVGGLDIAGMVGLYIGAAHYHIPVILDGVISEVAALVAETMVCGVRKYLIGSHKSKEPAAARIVDTLGLLPVIDAGMALGEGTGAVMMMQLIRTALAVYNECCPFAEVGISQYERFGETI
ncbi:nicotinate-nucleotide-dimethylbenzimidazole phosphoribosyltransferase [Lachnospiraceae bacterium XBB1006]|nr:nicotinate-nucleotide-dimethylbenzimidazole phosphoribosyltransferase [Lachnospiraceae bacterium XBB1006]